MKQNKVRLMASVLGISVLLSACGNQSGEVSSSSTTNEVDSTERVSIDFWYGLGSVAGETMEEIIKEFNESQENVTVKGVQQADYSETWQKVQASLAAQNAPAVFIAQSGTVNAYGGDEGVLEPLDEYLSTEGFNEDDLLDVFTKNNEIDGQTYAVPAYGTTQIMYFNQEVFDEAGIDPTEAFSSWENLASASEEIKEKTAATDGHMIMWGADNLADLALSNGGSFLSEDGKKATINQPEWVEAWEFARTQLHEDENMGIISGGQGWEYWYKTIDQVMTGNAGSYTGSSGDRGDLDFSKIDARKQPGLNGHEAKPVAGGLNMAIPKITEQEEKDAAFEWITYFTSAEVQAKWSQTIGYVPVRESTVDVPEYKQFLEENPYANIPFEQSLTASPVFIDPTGGKINDALTIAADKVELENISAKEALDEANQVAQKELDKINN